MRILGGYECMLISVALKKTVESYWIFLYDQHFQKVDNTSGNGGWGFPRP